MTTEQLIMEEAERRFYDVKNEHIKAVLIRSFIENATFGASLNGWISVKDRLPTDDEFGNNMVEAWDRSLECSVQRSAYQMSLMGNRFPYWRKIVKP